MGEGKCGSCGARARAGGRVEAPARWVPGQPPGQPPTRQAPGDAGVGRPAAGCVAGSGGADRGCGEGGRVVPPRPAHPARPSRARRNPAITTSAQRWPVLAAHTPERDGWRAPAALLLSLCPPLPLGGRTAHPITDQIRHGPRAPPPPRPSGCSPPLARPVPAPLMRQHPRQQPRQPPRSSSAPTAPPALHQIAPRHPHPPPPPPTSLQPALALPRPLPPQPARPRTCWPGPWAPAAPRGGQRAAGRPGHQTPRAPPRRRRRRRRRGCCCSRCCCPGGPASRRARHGCRCGCCRQSADSAAAAPCVPPGRLLVGGTCSGAHVMPTSCQGICRAAH